jgi:hypothetical protein
MMAMMPAAQRPTNVVERLVAAAACFGGIKGNPTEKNAAEKKTDRP